MNNLIRYNILIIILIIIIAGCREEKKEDETLAADGVKVESLKEISLGDVNLNNRINLGGQHSFVVSDRYLLEDGTGIMDGAIYFNLNKGNTRGFFYRIFIINKKNIFLQESDAIHEVSAQKSLSNKVYKAFTTNKYKNEDGEIIISDVTQMDIAKMLRYDYPLMGSEYEKKLSNYIKK